MVAHTKKYRKKPIVVEAVQLAADNRYDVAFWSGGKLEDDCILIPTLEGVMKADFGDFVIKGVKGEFYPCKADVFESSYEQVGLR